MAVQPGIGTVLKCDISAVQTAIVDVVEIKGPSKEVPKIKTTSLSSTRQTYRPGLPDSGEVTFSIWYDPSVATHAALEAMAENPAIKPWTLAFNDSGDATETFDGFVTKFEKSGMKEDENLQADVTIRVTGATVVSP